MDDLAEREAFFRAGGAGGGYAGPGPGNGGGPPPNRPPVNHPYGDERTPHGGAAGGNWGPSPDNAVTTREHLARQRQAEYNEHLLRQQHAKEQAHAARHGHQGGRQGQGQGGRPGQHNQQSQQNAGVSPGLQFDEEQQQRPRAKGFHGLRDIHNSGEKLRVKAEAAKKQYAAELQQQIEFKKRAKLVDKQHSLELDRHSLGMGNIITDMHDGTLDGVDENGSYMGYDYRDAHQPDEPRAYHPTQETPHQGQSQHGQQGQQGHEHGGGYDAPGYGPKGLTNAANAARENQLLARGSLSVMDNGQGPQRQRPGAGPPGGHWRDGVDQSKAAEKQRKAVEYQKDLDKQIRDKAQRKLEEKRATEEQEHRHEQDQRRYDPWGKGGGGAPVVSSENQQARVSNRTEHLDGGGYEYGGRGGDGGGRNDGGYQGNAGQQQGYAPNQHHQDHQLDQRRESNPGYPASPNGQTQYVPIVPGGRAGVPGHGRFAASGNGNGNGGASNPNPAPSSATRSKITNFRTENENPLALQAKHRAREELQHALRLQIEEKRLRKEEEKKQVEREAQAEDTRLRVEQERLREAFSREQFLEREKAEERMRLEEEAYHNAANKRSEQMTNDIPVPPEAATRRVHEPRDDARARVSENESQHETAQHGGHNNHDGYLPSQQQHQQGHPPQQVPPPPRGPTPAGARELNQLRTELQTEHKELMVQMRAQNANMAILSKRAEMAEKHSAEARVELAEMRENLADQAFISALPPAASTGDALARHGVDVPYYALTTTDPLRGPPRVSRDEDYGVFVRDGQGPHHTTNDLGPALDAGAPFVSLGNDANELAGDMGQHMGVGSPGRHKPSAKVLIRRGGLDVDDELGSIAGDSAFIFPGQTMERAPFLKGNGGGASVFSGPGAGRPAPQVGYRSNREGKNDALDGGVGVSTRYGGPDEARGGGDTYDDEDDAGMTTRDADLSSKLDAVYQKNAARMRALGVGIEGNKGSGGEDPDQLEGLLQNFLRANRGDVGTNRGFDAGEPPDMAETEFDDPADGLNVAGAEDDDFGLGRPNTQMSMQAETRFVGSQY